MKLADASSEERMGFVQKVYGVTGVQVGMTALMCVLAMNSTGFLEVLLNPALLVLSLLTSIGLVIALCCSKYLRSHVPLNYGLLGLFTVCEGHFVSISCTLYDKDIVVLAFVLTAGVFLVLTGYAMTANKDFTIAWEIALTLAVASLFIAIMRLFFFNDTLQLLACLVGILCASFYILYDTQMIFGGQRHSFEIDDYILAALNLYLDLVRLFVKLLQFLGKLKEKDKKK